MLKDLLVIKGSAITVTRTVVASDGMGGVTATSTITGLPRAAMWSPSQSKPFISDKIARMSSHVLVTMPDDYIFTYEDVYITYQGKNYTITGPSDDVALKGEICVTGLELIV